MMIDETWMPIPSEPGYSASSHGRIRSDERVQSRGERQPRYTIAEKILAVQPDKYGYMRLALGRGNFRRVHRLVTEAYLGPCSDDKQVNHIDGDKANNCLGNLEYVTQLENMRHANEIGLFRDAPAKRAAHRSLAAEEQG